MLESTESFLTQKTSFVNSYQWLTELLKILQFGMEIPFWPQEQAKLLSIVNAKFTLITLSRSLLYGVAHCNTQELEWKIINIFFISINNKQSLKGIIQDAVYEIDVFQNFSTLQYSCPPPLLKILEKYFWRS